MYNEAKLRGKIAEARLSILELAQRLGMNPTTLHRKIKGETEFTRSEIYAISKELHCTEEETKLIFFAESDA